MVSVGYQGAELEREGRRRWLELTRTSCDGTGPPRCQLRGLEDASGAARTSVPSVRQPGPRCPVLSLQAAASAPAPQPHVRPRLCGDHREGHQGTIVTRSPWFVRERSCGLGGVPSPYFLPGGTRFLFEFSNYLGSRVSSPRPCPLSLALSRAGNKSLNVRNPPHIPKAIFPSLIHSIIINYLSSVVHFKQTQYFNCLSFSPRALDGPFFSVYFCLWVFSMRRKQRTTSWN